MNAPGQAVAAIKPTDLRGILNYVPRFHGQIFIIALDGVIVADENLPNLLLDVAVLRSLQIKVVLVHGIGHQLKELSVIRQIPLSDTHGAGVTDAATLDLAIRASSRVSHQILEGLTQSGLKCAITNCVRAAPVGVMKGVDHQFSGKVDRIDTDFITNLINAGAIPIIQPIGFDRDGHSLRINSDLLATELATELHATKIVFLAPHAGFEIRGELRRQIGVDELSGLLAAQPDAVDSRVHSKAQHAVRAIRAGVPRVHLVDGRIHDALLSEIFSNEGVGTLVYGNDYQQIRKATRRDARRIYNLTRHAVKREELVHRTLQAVERNIENFYVFEIDENLIACVSLTFYPDKPEVAEIGSLYVLPFYHRRGIGKKMIEFACLEAKQRGAAQVIALSTQSFTFFSSVCGFTETTKDALPAARLQVFEQSQRNPRVLIKRVKGEG
ncbi:MAG: amino-acid N-acetyltransferase [Opitutaceae bacterium]